MQTTDSEHITGRRFDGGDGSNLVLFRSADLKIGNGNSKRLHDQDMLDFVRAQEQKLKLEKLKWHENTVRVTALTAKPVIAAQNKPTKAPRVKANDVLKADVQAKPVAKPRVSPKNVADLIEDRTKRASQWLHQEQREFAAKKAEIAEHKRAAKELDQKIRAQQHQDAEKKRQKQLRLLYEDPAVQMTLPAPVAIEAAASAQTLPPRMPVQASAAATSTSTALMAAQEVRVSYDTRVIQQVASQLQLPEHPENDLLLAHKRPRVPLLSRSYVNKSNLVHVGAGEHHNSAGAPEEPVAPVLLTKRERIAKKADDSGSESEGYGDDEDFEQTDSNKADTAPADAALVQKVFRNERYSTPHSRAHSDGESDDESDGEGSQQHHHHHSHSAAVDEITRQSEELSQKRREDGKEYAARKRQQEHRREEEARRAKALEEEKRKLALAQLKTRVVGINRRTKHTVSGAATGSLNSHTPPQSTSNITSTTGTPASAPIRAMLSGSPDPSEHGEAQDGMERPSIASIKEFVMNKYDFLPRQMLSADEVDSVNYNDFNSEYVDSAANSRPQSRLTDAPYEDLRNLDPREAGGWKQFLDQERRLLKAAQENAAVRESTPPRLASTGRPATALSSSQTRSRASPPSARPVSAASQQAAVAMAASQARRPTPPPFRFNSWQGQATSGAKRQDERPDRGTHVQTRSMGGAGTRAEAENFRSAASATRSASTGRSRPHQEPPKRLTAKKTMNTQPTGPRSNGRKSLPPRSSSAGSQGLAQRRRRSQGSQPAAQSRQRYAQPVQKSRSVLHQGSREDKPGGDTFDLFERYGGSDDDQPNFHEELDNEYDEYGAYGEDGGREDGTTPTQPASGLGGYLSRSPARGFLPEADQYRSEHDLESLLVPPRTDGIAARSLDEARLMQDVSFQAIKNFEQVTRVLQDVDRWCERAKHDTLELQEKLRLRESTESLVGLYPRAANDFVPQMDRSDIDIIRSSLVGRLASASELMPAPASDSDTTGSVDRSQSQSDSHGDSLGESEDDRSKYSYELSEEERNGGDDTSDNGQESGGEEPLKPHASWNDHLSAPFKSSTFDLSARQKSEEADRFGSEKRKYTEESEDTVLMASDGEDNDEDDGTGASEPEAASDDELHLTYPHSAANPPLQSASSNLLLLNTNRADRPLIWAPGSSRPAAHSVAQFSAKDPLMTQQLGLAADRNEIFAKFANIRASDFDTPEGSVDYVRSAAVPARAEPYSQSEDWSKPLVRSAPAAGRSDSQPSYLPSLRNVGELAGLLRSTYRLDISTETGRAAVLERSSDDDSDSDSQSDADSVIGENYDNFSAVSIFASKMMQQQAAQLAAKEAAMKTGLPAQVPVDASITSVASERSHEAASTVGAPIASSESDDKEDSFYSSEAIAKRLARFEDTSMSALDPPDIPTDELLHDYIMTARYGIEGTAPESSTRHAVEGEEEKTEAARKVRFSGAEMRMRMMDELRRQDELFNYTMELADMEKTNALQGARDLAMQAQQRSEKEFAVVKQQQELDMQRLAYENALALSLVNAQAAMDKHAMEQREHVVQLEAQIGVQEMFRQYQDLLHQADHVAGSLEHNQKLLQLEKLMHEGHARDVAADLESKHATERASLVLAHAEVQQSQAMAMAAASRSSWQAAEASHAQAAQVHAQAQALAQAQMLALSQAQTLAQVPRHAGSPGRRSRNRLEESTGAAARYAQDSFEDEDYEEEYSTQFEAEASVSMVSKPFTRTHAGTRRGALAQNDSTDSIPEDVSSEPAEQHSLSVSDSVHYSPGDSVRLSRAGLQRSLDKSGARKLHDSTQSIQSASSSSREAPARRPTATRTQEAEDSYVEDDIPEDAMEETGEVTEESESVFESYQDSPVKASATTKTAAMSYSRVSTDFGASVGSQSHSQSRSALEVSERSRGPTQSHAQQSRSHASEEHSGDFEVEDEDAFEQDDASIPEEEVGEEEDGYDNYSDTFEASGSKGSKSSSLSNRTPPLRRAQPVASTGLLQTGVSRTFAIPTRTTIPAALDASLDKDAFDKHDVGAVLDEYRSEMEQRLRAQEKTYKLKVQFLRAKQAQRLEWLEKVRQNKKIKASDIDEEEQRIHDTYAEERAEVERERWALNARSYKELRKFKRLRKELVSYQVNMENSSEAAAEFESALLSLERRGSDMRTSREMQQQKQRFGLRESSDSVSSSSDSNVMFGQFKNLGSAAGAVDRSSKAAAAHAPKGSVIASSKVESANDDSYADEFETTFSRSNSPVKAASINKSAASPQPRGGKFSERSYSGVYEDLETSAASAAEEVPSESEAEDEVRQGSVASEIPEEQDDASFNDSIEDAPYASQLDQDVNQNQDEDDLERSRASQSAQQEYSHEEFEETGVSASYKPDNALAPSVGDFKGSAAQEASSSGSYEEDFVEGSNGSEESKSTAEKSPQRSPPKVVAALQRVEAPAEQDEESEVSEVIDEIESEDDAQSRHSDASSEEYRLETSHKDISRDQGDEHGRDQHDSGEFDHNLQGDKAEDSFQSPQKPAEESHHSRSFEDSYHSDGEGEEEPKAGAPVSTSMHSLGSRSASAQEDQDAVNLQDEDDGEASDEYASEFDSEPEDNEQDDSQRSPTAKESTAVQQKTEREVESEAEEIESIATEEDEDEDGEGSAVLGQRSGSNSESDDYFKASGIVVSPAVSPLKSESSISPLRSDGSPVVVETKRVAITMAVEQPQKISPATSFSPMRSQHSERSVSGEYSGAASDDPEVWGSEDFAESPSAFSRKTSDLMMHQLSSDSAFGPSPTRESSGNNMVYDADQQRWVGGEEVSLDGFDESIGAVDNDHDLSSHATHHRGDDERPELVRGSSSESRRSHSDSIEEVDESSFSEDEDVPAPLQPIQSLHSHSHSQDHLPGSHRGIAINAASPWESGTETSASSSPLAGSRLKPFEAPTEQAEEAVEAGEYLAVGVTDEDKGEEDRGEEEDYGSDFSDDAEPSKAEINQSKLDKSADKYSDAGSEVESDIEEVEDEIVSEADAGEESYKEATPQSSPAKAAATPADPVAEPAAEPTLDADEANATMLSAVSAVEESIAVSATDLSALLASTDAAQLDSLSLQHEHEQSSYLASEQDTLEGGISGMSFDHLEPLQGAEEQRGAGKPTSAAQTKVDDSLLDDLDFGSDSEVEEDKNETEEGLASEATEEADLDDFDADYIEEVAQKAAVATITASADDSSVEIPEYEISEELETFEPEVELIVIPASPEKAVVEKSEEEKKQNQQQKEQEQRLVLVEEVTDHLLDALVEAETRRVLALVPHSSSRSTPRALSEGLAAVHAQAKDTVSDREVDHKARKEIDEDDLSADLDELAETLTLSSSRFAPKTHTQAQAKDSAPESTTAKRDQPESKSSLPVLTSHTSLTSLGALPSLGAKKYSPALDVNDEVDEEDDYSLKALVPAEFDDEDVYEFDIPTNKAPVLSLAPVTPEDTEESRAGAALAAALAAAEAVQQQCAHIVSETKAFVGAVVDDAGPDLMQRLGDPLFQGRFVDVPAMLADGVDEQPAIHKGALADRINELCEEIFEAKHATGPSSSQPFSRRLLLQTLPLQSSAVRAHLLAQVAAEQSEHSATLQSATAEVVPSIDSLDAFRQETSEEIRQACDHMADALLARALIETVADLGKFYDLTKLFL